MDNKVSALTHLCQLLCPSDPSLTGEVTLAREDPQAHAKQYPARVEGWSWTDVSADWFIWYAFLAGLSARGRLRSIDWRQAPQEVMDFQDDMLPSALSAPDRWSWVDISFWEEQPTCAFLTAIAKRLLDLGLSLVYLDADADSYPLIVIDSRDFPRLKELATLAGYDGAWVWPMADAED